MGGHDRRCTKPEGARRGGRTGRSPGANAVAAESASSWQWWDRRARVAVTVVVVVAAAAVGVVCRCRRGGVVVVVVVGGVVVVALSCQAQGARGGVANLSMPASWRGRRRRRAWRVVTTSWWLGDKSAVGLSENFNFNLVLYSYTSLRLRVENLYSVTAQRV